MRRPSTSDLAIGLGAVALAGAITALESAGLPELLFYSVLLSILGVLGRLTLRAARLTVGEQRRATQLAGVRPADAALAAVHEERLRLTADIAESLREAMLLIRAEAREARVGPELESRLRRIHAATQRATSELRRHLGLLRSPAPDDDGSDPDGPEPRIPRRDVVLAASMVPLAIAESIAYPMTEGMEGWSVGSVLTTALAAATVIGRTVALGPAVLGCATAFAVGTLVGAPVVEGFWLLGSVAVLVWSVFARPELRPSELVGVGLLMTSVVVTRQVDSPDNLAVAVVIPLVAAGAALVVRLIRVRGDAATVRSAELEQELRAAAATAVGAERVTFARELHDVVSHAVGVIAMQAGAAEVSWQQSSEDAERALAVIRSTADSTLTELDRLGPGDRGPWTLADVHALVARIRAAGTGVDVTVEGDVPPPLLHVVHRVVQEALTNVVRHAPDAHAHVTICADADRTTVEVVDDGPGAEASAHRGYGLIGLGERVAFAGGAFSTGPGPEGHGFRVAAVLPVTAAAVTP